MFFLSNIDNQAIEPDCGRVQFATRFRSQHQQFSYEISGPADGHPLLAFHGLPGTAQDFFPGEEVLAANNVRLICVDRPGYRDSDPWPGYRLDDFSSVTKELVDHLGLEKLSLLGFSGGSPYALALARRIPTRVDSLFLVSPLGPLDGELLAHLPENSQHLYQAAVRDTAGLADQLAKMLPSHDSLWTTVKSLASEADQDVLEDLTVRKNYPGSLAASIRQGTKGLAEDLRVCGSPWGFGLDEIQSPVIIWHGDEDIIIPPAIVDHLESRLPTVHRKTFTGEGHYLLFRQWAELLEEVGNVGRKVP